VASLCALAALSSALPGLADPPRLELVDLDARPFDPARDHVAVARGVPADPTSAERDPDVVRLVVSSATGLPPSSVRVSSLPAPDGGARVSELDALSELALVASPCPPGHRGSCATSEPFLVVVDALDRNHPLLRGRALIGEVGGALRIDTGADGASLSVRIGGPRQSELGPLARSRARLRVHVLRLVAGGSPAIGRDERDAVRMVRAEVARASALWGACGVSFGPEEELDVRVVDPPPPSMLALGCDHGLPASGGSLRFSVDGRELAVTVAPGSSARSAARVVARALESAGFVAVVSDNAAIGAATHPTSDVSVRRRDGKPALVSEPRRGRVSDDASLEVCVGRVALEDGLQHFADADAIAGTLEERALIKAFDDGDPSTIDVYVVPSFGGDSRIGESFIFADHGAIKNVVLEDRAGVRAHQASFTLAHELGHVLLDQPGHPDDFGADAPTRLMDADALNPTAFGPRRFALDECVRAQRQSGPGTPAPLLAPWPFAPLEPSAPAPRP